MIHLSLKMPLFELEHSFVCNALSNTTNMGNYMYYWHLVFCHGEVIFKEWILINIDHLHWFWLLIHTYMYIKIWFSCSLLAKEHLYIAACRFYTMINKTVQSTSINLVNKSLIILKYRVLQVWLDFPKLFINIITNIIYKKIYIQNL